MVRLVRNESLGRCGQQQTAVYERAAQPSLMGKPRGMFKISCRWYIPPELGVEMYFVTNVNLRIGRRNVKDISSTLTTCVWR